MPRMTGMGRLIGAALWLAAGAHAAAWAQAPGDRPAPLPQPAKLVVGYNKVPHVSPLKLIVERTAPLNLEVQLVEFVRYADTRTALASGSIEIGTVGPADVPIAVSQGITSIIGIMGVGISPKNPIAHKGVVLEKWDDLKGKRVGIAPGSAVWFQFAATLQEVGVPYNQLQIVNIQGGGMPFVQSMQRGDLDVYAGWEPFESMSEMDGSGFRVTKLDYSKSKAVGDELGLIAVSRPALDTKREAVRRFLWAYLDAQREAMTSEDKLTQTISAWTGLEPQVSRNVARVTKLGQFLTMDQVKRQAAAFHQFGVLTKDVSAELDKYFDQEIVKTVSK
jgi:sulfonate transport system substrate-binding protein